MVADDSPVAKPAVQIQNSTSEDAAETGDLRKRVLPLWAVYATAIAVVAPTGSLAFGMAGVSSAAGNATWLSFAIVTVGILGVAYCISFTARRFSSPGGLYGLASRVGGNSAGYAQGVPQLLTLLISMPITIFGSGIYLASALHRAGLPDNTPMTFLCYAIIIVLGGYAILRDIRVSTRALLILEGVSVLLILGLFAVVLARHQGGIVDHSQLTLKGAHFHGILLSFAFATFTIAGFETAATLGSEARNPKRDIPKALLGSVVILGVLYVFSSYVQVLGLPNGALAASGAPLDDLANLAHVGWFGAVIDVCVAVSFYSCFLGGANGTARILFALGRDGAISSRFGRISRHGQPQFAILVILGYVSVFVLIVGLLSRQQNDAFVNLGTLAGYYLFALYLIAVALAVILALRTRSLTAALVVAALIGAGTLLNGLYFTFVPWPQGVVANLFWTFVGTAVVAVALATWGKASNARWWKAIGTSAIEGD